jgi:hypothetical protein
MEEYTVGVRHASLGMLAMKILITVHNLSMLSDNIICCSL